MRAGGQTLASWCGIHVVIPGLQLSQDIVSTEMSVYVHDWIVSGSTLDWSDSESESIDIGLGAGTPRFRFSRRLADRVSGISESAMDSVLKRPQ